MIQTKGSWPGTYKERSATIYNPHIGLFITPVISTSLVSKPTCLTAEFTEMKLFDWQQIELFAITSPEFKRIFDSFQEDPETLKETIDAGPPYFRQDGKWKGEDTTVNLLHYISGARNFKEAAARLSGVDPAEIQRVLARRVDSIRAVREESKRRVQEFEEASKRRRQEDQLKRQLAQQEWENRLQRHIAVGDAVCTYDSNLFGNIETIEGGRIKVYVIGKAQVIPGYFFSGQEGQFSYEKIEGYRWLDRAELAHCGFKP